MKRIDAIEVVTQKLKGLKSLLNEGKSVSPIEFFTLSEIFKFQIEPKSHRFTATCLDEAAKTNDSKKHLEMLDVVLKEQGNQDVYAMVGNPPRRMKVGQTSSTSTGTTSGETTEKDWEETAEVNELLDYDGSIQSSKIPPGVENVKSLSSRKTTDDVEKATRQGGTWTGAGNWFKQYYGESVEEIGEIDKSGVLGVDETDQLDFDGAVDYYEKELEMPKDEAIERVEKERGPETLETGKKEGSFTRHRLTEKEKHKKLAEDKARNMIEVILSNSAESGELTEKDINLTTKKINGLVRFAKANGIKDVNELLDMVKSKWNE